MIIFLLSLIATFLGFFLYLYTFGTWQFVLYAILIAIIITAIYYIVIYLIRKKKPKAKGHFIYNPNSHKDN